MSPVEEDTAGGAATPGSPHFVEVWQFPLNVGGKVLQQLKATLSLAEKERAARFVQPSDGDRFIAGRGRLRQILSRDTDLEPAALEFGVSGAGKPYLRTPRTAPHFNLSHSGDAAALAVCRTAEVGIDIERLRPVRDGLAERYFSMAEAEALAALPEAARLMGFFRCWTRKEAFLKATGEGIRRGLDSFRVTVGPDEAARIQSIDGDCRAAQSWTIIDLEAGPDFVGAVAVHSGSASGVRLVTRELPDNAG